MISDGNFNKMVEWLRRTLLILAGIFFLLFGIQVLMAAYRLNDPFLFIMTFFSASFIILISTALLIAFIWRWRAHSHNERQEH